MHTDVIATTSDPTTGRADGIPIRNLWLLMLYASDLYRHTSPEKAVAAEDNPDEIPDLVAEILAHAVETRLNRNLTYNYRSERAILGRVRGRIDALETVTRQLLSRGAVACRFDQLSVDTPRNQYVRAALDAIAGITRRPGLARRCRTLSICLERLGVSKQRPSRTMISTERFGRHDVGDRRMVAAARLAFDLLLPTEFPGGRAITSSVRDSHWLQRLYERAVGGFYAVTLSAKGWRVDTRRRLSWPLEWRTGGVDDVLPAMQTDIVLEYSASSRRIVIDTKFTSILTRGRFREGILKSGYLYQIYTYLRTQENSNDPLSQHAGGLLLHPSLGEAMDEVAVIQGHAIRFATVDLSAAAGEIRKQLLEVADFSFQPY